MSERHKSSFLESQKGKLKKGNILKDELVETGVDDLDPVSTSSTSEISKTIGYLRD